MSRANAAADDDRPGAVDPLPFEIDDATALGGSFRGDRARARSPTGCASEGGDLVGQEAVTLSTTPVLGRTAAWCRGR